MTSNLIGKRNRMGVDFHYKRGKNNLTNLKWAYLEKKFDFLKIIFKRNIRRTLEGCQ